MRNWLGFSLAGIVAVSAASCFTQEDDDTVDAGTKRDAGGNTVTDGGGGTDGGSNPCIQDSSLTPTSYTVNAAVGKGRETYVEIKDAVVVAGRVYNQSGTFWIQDASGGPGLAVYKNYKDDTTFPEIGDVVTVKGRLTVFNGSTQIATSCGLGVLLSVTKTGTGTATSGAMPPAGSPTIIPEGKRGEYAHTELTPHPEQVGTVVQFAGPIDVTNSKPTGLVETTQSDGGTKVTPRGFEISGGVWVDDDLIYAACLRSLDGGTPDLSNGIRGVWERYQDFNGEKVTYPVLKPVSCDDLNPSSQND